MKEFLRISSKENDVIKLIMQLQKSSSARKEEGLFVLEGLRLCMDAHLNGFATERLIVSDSAMEKLSEEIVDLSESAGRCYVIPDKLFDKISDTVSPQGVMCLCKLKDISENLLNPKGMFIALENLQDPSNLGAISRTAEALGISGIIMAGGCDPYSPKSLRASMGALLRLPVYQSNNLFDIFDEFSLKSYAAVVRGPANKAGEFRFEEGSVVVIGNEANGLTDATVQRCNEKITIPMNGRAESLKAGVAASILMWEMCKC